MSRGCAARELDPSQNQVFFDHDTLNKVVIQTQYEEEVSGMIEVRRDAQPGTAGRAKPLG